MHAARVAARIRKELGEPVEMKAGRYGEFRVKVDDDEIVASGALGFLGVLPPAGEVLAKVRAKLGR